MSKRQQAGETMRTNEFNTKHKKKETDYDYSKDIVTTTLYCVCQDCMKYCDYRKPVQCIDPFLMDMKHTYWIYHGLVSASRTERAITITDPEKMEKKVEKKKGKKTAKGN